MRFEIESKNAAASEAPGAAVHQHRGLALREKRQSREWTVENRSTRTHGDVVEWRWRRRENQLSPYTSAWPSCWVADWIGTLPGSGPCLRQYVARMKSRSSIAYWPRIVQHCGGSFADLGGPAPNIARRRQRARCSQHQPTTASSPRQKSPLHRVSQAACDLKPKLLLLDNSADVYGGNENASWARMCGNSSGCCAASPWRPALGAVVSGFLADWIWQRQRTERQHRLER